MKTQPDFSVVIPSYNEEVRKEAMFKHLKDIDEYFKKLGKSHEIIWVLDGPTDETPKLAKKETEKYPQIKLIDRKENKGKGYSVREGFRKANGKICLFTDTDGATPIHMLDKFIPEFEKGADIVIGSRDMAETKIKVHQPIWKELMGDAGNLLIQALTGLWGMKDTQCGFKAFTREAVEDIFPRTTVDRWGLDFELLMIGKRRGFKIIEVPIEWIDSGDSLVGISGYFSTFRDLFKVKWNMIRGVYKLKKDVNEFKDKK